MSQPTNPQRFVRLELTPGQREQVQAHTGRSSEAIELTREELEERVAPLIDGRYLNHNETQAAETLEERIAPLGGWTNHNETMLD